jgi:YD repeat-containing protein
MGDGPPYLSVRKDNNPCGGAKSNSSPVQGRVPSMPFTGGQNTMHIGWSAVSPGHGYTQTRTGCYRLPLKSGGFLDLEWTENSSQGVNTGGVYSDSWFPAGLGGVFSFLPFVANSTDVYLVITGRTGNKAYTNGPPYTIQQSLPLSMQRSSDTDYYAELDLSTLTYYVYSAVVPDLGRTLLRRDRNGNVLHYNYSSRIGMSGGGLGVLRSITGDLSSVIPYFSYNLVGGNEVLPCPIRKIFLLDTSNPTSSGRAIYYNYDSSDQLAQIIYPGGCTIGYQIINDGGGTHPQIRRETDADSYNTYFRYANNTTISLCGVFEPENRTTYYQFDTFEMLRTAIIPAGREITYYSYIQTGTIYIPLPTNIVDSLGNVTTLKNDVVSQEVCYRAQPNGNITYYSFNPQYAQTQVCTTFNNATIQNLYAANGYDLHALVGRRFVAGSFPEVTYYNYDKPSGNPLSVMRPLGFTTYMAYDSLGRIHKTADPLVNTSYFNYDAVTGFNTSTVDALGHVSYFGYDGYRKLKRQVSPRWIETGVASAWTTYYAFDLREWVHRSTNALGQSTYFDFTGRGDLLATIDPRNVVNQSGYNGLRLETKRFVLNSSQALVAKTYFNYDTYKNKFRETNGNGYSTYFAHDALDRLTGISDALGNTTAHAYDTVGNRVKTQDARSHTTYFLFDPLSRRYGLLDALQNLSYFGYDLGDFPVKQRDARGNSIIRTFDPAGRNVTSVNALSQISYFGYDGNDNLVVARDPLGRSTLFTYDRLNRPTLAKDALNNATYYGYDAAGNTVKVLDARSNLAKTAFDVLDRPRVAQDALLNATYFGYDAVGNRVKTVDARRNTTYFNTDALNRRYAVIDPANGATYFGYDLVGNAVKSRDQRGNATINGFDALNRLNTVTDASSGVAYFGYDQVGNKVKDRDQRGNLTMRAFDALNRVSTVTDANAGVVYFGYDQVGNTVKNQNQRGNRTMQSFDVLNRPLVSTDAAGGTVYFGYDAVGNLVDRRDQRSYSTHIGYDALNRPLTVTDPLGGLAYFGYDQIGNRVKWRDARSNATTAIYDKLNRPTLITDPLANTTYLGYDQVGNRTKVSNGLNHLSQWTYDVLNRPFLATNGANQTSYYGYDPVGNITEVRNPLGYPVTLTYDQLNRVSQIANPLNQTSKFAYDHAGNRVKEVDGLNQATYFSYDALNRLAGIVDPLNNTSYFGYDSTSNLTISAARTANVPPVLVGYDVLNRKRVVADTSFGPYGYGTQAYGTTPYGGSAQYDAYDYFSYDAASNLTGMLDSGGVSAFGYDALNRRFKRQYPRTGTAYFLYDLASNRTAVQFPGTTQQAQYTFDADNRMAKLLSPDSKAAYFTYDKASNLVKRRFGNSSVCYYQFDAAERVIGINHLTSAGVPIVTMAYQRDAAGRIVKVARETDLAIYYGYDTADRLLKELWAKKSTSAQIYAFCYQYDAAGNRLFQWRFGAPNVLTEKSYYTYNSANAPVKRWVTPTNVATYFAYNAAGSLTTLLVGTSATYFQYAVNGFISQITPPAANGLPWQFGYDGLLNRARILKGATPVYYAWDGMNQLEERDSTGTQLIARYSHGPSPIPGIGSVMEVHRQTATTTYYQYLHMDHMGTVKQVTDVNQAVQLSYVTDAFGRQIVPIGGANTNVLNDLQYQSNWLTVQIGTRWYGISPSRIYDPELGRFLQRDPLPNLVKLARSTPRGNRRGIYSRSIFSDGITSKVRDLSYDPDLNLYVYVRNNPVNAFDAFGLFWGAILGAVAGTLVGAAVGAITAALTGQESILQGALSGAAGGAAFGAVAGLTGNLYLAGAAGAAASSLALSLLTGQGKAGTTASAVISTGLGALTGPLGPLARPLAQSIYRSATRKATECILENSLGGGASVAAGIATDAVGGVAGWADLPGRSNPGTAPANSDDNNQKASDPLVPIPNPDDQ